MKKIVKYVSDDGKFSSVDVSKVEEYERGLELDKIVIAKIIQKITFTVVHTITRKDIIDFAHIHNSMVCDDEPTVNDTFDDYYEYNFQYQLDDYCNKFEEYCFSDDDREYIYHIERYDT